MSLKGAITLLELEVKGLGTPVADSSKWWLLQAKSLGLSLLRTFSALGLDYGAADAYRQEIRKQLVTPEEPPSDSG